MNKEFFNPAPLAGPPQAGSVQAFPETYSLNPFSKTEPLDRVSVLTRKDKIIRVASVAASVLLLGGLVAVTLPAVTAGGAALGVAAWMGAMTARTLYKELKHADLNEGKRVDTPPALAKLTRKFRHSAGVAADFNLKELPQSSNIIRMQVGGNLGEGPYLAYSQGMRTHMSKKSFVGFVAHEIGHLGYDGAASPINSFLRLGGRTLRWGLLGTVAKAALIGAAGPAAPLVAAAIAVPYAMSVVHAFNRRNDELVNDRFASVVMGSILPITQGHAAYSRFNREMRDNPELRAMRDYFSGPRAHTPTQDSKIPFTKAHPSPQVRRRALHKLQPQILNQARRRDVNSVLKSLS